MKKQLWITLCVVAGITLIGVCVYFLRHNTEEGAKPGETTKLPPTKLKIGYLRIAASLPLFVAVEEKMFHDAGFDVELIPFISSNDLGLAGATKKVDILASCAVNAAVDAMAVSKSEMTVFLVNGYRKKDEFGRPTDHLIVRKGAKLADLKGKPVAFFPGSVCKVFAREIFAKHGESLDDVLYVEMSPQEWLPALKAGRIEAVNAVEPAATLILDDPAYESLIPGFFAELQPDVPLSAFWFSSSVPETERDAIRAVFQKALRFISDQRIASLNHYQQYTDIPQKVYERIGMNNWQMTKDNGTAQAGLTNFVNTLYGKQAIRGYPTGNWYE